MKTKIIWGVFLPGALLAATGFFLLGSGHAVTFESRESRTIDGNPVYNRIRYERRGGQDIWMMQQSHAGAGAPHGQWDRIAIVVNRGAGTARYFQLEPGPLEWTGQAKELPFKVACALCHANGPRAVRPNFESAAAPLSLRDRLQVLAWNLRVKAHGRVQPDPVHLLPGSRFRFTDLHTNAPLRVKTCTTCHKNEGFLARGELTRHQFMSIKFLVEQGEMPPPGFKLSAEERQQIERFVGGG